MSKEVSFVWTGAPGVYGKRTLTGDVLETRARRDGGTDFLVKSADLPLSKWINAEFCAVLPEVVVTVQKPEPVAKVEQLLTPREWLIAQGYELARAAGVTASVALEVVVNEWC